MMMYATNCKWIRSFAKAARFHCSSKLTQVVSSHNEWDPLEEIIVGRIENPRVPPLNPEVKATRPKKTWPFFEENAEKCYPSAISNKAKEEVENLCSILEGEGVKVLRPDSMSTEVDFKTPDFNSPIDYFNAMPRDILLVIGNKIIEAPMAWRCRYFEYRSYRNLLKNFFAQGAEWIVAPKPLMSDELYDREYPFDNDAARQEWTEAGKFVTTEFEPCFDAADFFRCGRDIIGQRSHVTNFSGIEWLRRQLGEEYRLHTFTFHDPLAMHIDTSFFIPKPGIVVINPTLPCNNYSFFEKAGWKLLISPPPSTPESHPLWMSSAWLSLNTLMLDTERVVVEAQEYPMHKFFENLGIKCIKVPFRNAYSFGGGIHCYTSDIRRRGLLQSYF